jgi:hypothetical protein
VEEFQWRTEVQQDLHHVQTLTVLAAQSETPQRATADQRRQANALRVF